MKQGRHPLLLLGLSSLVAGMSIESEQGFLWLAGTPKEQVPGQTPLHSDSYFPAKTQASHILGASATPVQSS